MLVKYLRIHVGDPSWVTPDFKQLIRLRQKAFISGDTVCFKHYRNAVNRERKTLHRRYFESKAHQHKDTKPAKCWSTVNKLAGMSASSGSEELLSKLHAVNKIWLTRSTQPPWSPCKVSSPSSLLLHSLTLTLMTSFARRYVV